MEKVLLRSNMEGAILWGTLMRLNTSIFILASGDKGLIPGSEGDPIPHMHHLESMAERAHLVGKLEYSLAAAVKPSLTFSKQN